MKLKVKVLLVILVLAIISNAVVHIFEIRNSINEETRLTVEIVKRIFNFQRTKSALRKQDGGITDLHNRVSVLEKEPRTIVNKTIVNKVERQTPDFEKLMNATVTIYNRGYVVAGVAIAEDETYYYILTCEHILKDKKVYIMDERRNVIPESNMGLAVDLQSIISFLSYDELKELVPKEEIINITVQTRDYTSVAGEFMYVNSMLDLGFLRIYKASGIKLEIIKTAEIYPELGDEVYVIGHPLGTQYNLSKGIISNLDRPFLMSIDALMTFGNSGGGVFNIRGELIGISSRVPIYFIKKDGEESEKKDYYEYFIY